MTTRFLVLVAFLVVAPIAAKADLSNKQARKLITRIAGFELPNSAVRVKQISVSDDSSAVVTAEVSATFRLMKNNQEQWRVAEVRSGPMRWEGLEFMSDSRNFQEALIGCVDPDLSSRPSSNGLSTKRARCLIAALLSVQLPSDKVRIKSVSVGLSLASRPSALVEALLTLDLRFGRDGKSGWVITGVRTGDREWTNPETLVEGANEIKKKQALTELGTIATALERFRAERHFFVATESHSVLIDHLSPRFLPKVIRIDPWQEPYRYRGDHENYTLRSLGPDRKENTADDIVVSAPSR
ncbi:MAG: type II secretion system protein GspG [Pyrinomonadaceae bacterium]